ncbi:MAG: hypothetical protein ACREB6_05465 [Rhodospirillales bacterium]
MAKTTKPDTILIVDDEPESIFWMYDYIEARGFSVLQHTTLNSAIGDLGREIYRAAIIDLNIPALEPLDRELRASGTVYARYPGLYAARFARTKGYRDRQVLLYTVHQDASVLAEAQRLGCTYLMKGRPQSFKEELNAVLSYDPTNDDKFS